MLKQAYLRSSWLNRVRHPPHQLSLSSYKMRVRLGPSICAPQSTMHLKIRVCRILLTFLLGLLCNLWLSNNHMNTMQMQVRNHYWIQGMEIRHRFYLGLYHLLTMEKRGLLDAIDVKLMLILIWYSLREVQGFNVIYVNLWTKYP